MPPSLSAKRKPSPASFFRPKRHSNPLPRTSSRAFRQLLRLDKSILHLPSAEKSALKTIFNRFLRSHPLSASLRIRQLSRFFCRDCIAASSSAPLTSPPSSRIFSATFAAWPSSIWCRQAQIDAEKHDQSDCFSLLTIFQDSFISDYS